VLTAFSGQSGYEPPPEEKLRTARIISRQGAKNRKERQENKDILLCVLCGSLRLGETICFFLLLGKGKTPFGPTIHF
jgi:hypothetical protein